MRIVTRRRGAVVAAALTVSLAGVVPALTATSAEAALTTTFKFNPALELKDANGANTGAAEPSIDIDTPGNVYVSGPAGVPTGGCPFWTVHPGTFNEKGLPYDYRGTIDTDHGGVGGGDCDISHGARSTLPPGNNADNVSVSSLSLANLTTNTSQDRGKTFGPVADPFGQQVFVVDRQWQAADRDLKTLYLTVHDIATANIQVAVSYDGGLQYASNLPAITDALPAAINNNHFSTTVVDTKTHKLYIAFVAPANATENANGGKEHVVYVAVGDPCATTACTPGLPIGPIKWTNHKLYTAPATQSLAHIFPIVAIDRGDPGTGANKNVYVAWAGDTKSSVTNRIQMTHFNVSAANPSTDAAAPIFVDDGSNHSNMFPWLVAGKKGVVNAAWYSGKTVGNGAQCPDGKMGTPDDSNGVNNNCFNQWRVTFAQVTGAAGSSPVVTRSYASGVNHKGAICDNGLGCSLNGDDRSLLDFFDMDLDPAGGANIAYVQDPSQIVYTRQCSGKSATTGLAIKRSCGPLAPPTPPGPTSVCGTAPTYTASVATDPKGDAVNPTGGGGTGSVDIEEISLADPVAAPAAGDTIDVTLKIANLQPTPPPGTTTQYYYVTWTGPDGKQYGVEHVEPQPALKTYRVGEFDTSSNRLKTGTTKPVQGDYNAGPDGTIVWHVPKAFIGNPTVPVDGTPAGGAPAVDNPYSVTILGLGTAATGGLVFVQPADRAPNAGFGADWAVCPT